MSLQHNDNKSTSVNGPSCSYATLSRYNNEKEANNNQQHSASSSSGSSGSSGDSGMVVPGFGEPGYNVLEHGNSGCGGYPRISNAYRSNGNCSYDYSGGHCG